MLLAGNIEAILSHALSPDTSANKHTNHDLLHLSEDILHWLSIWAQELFYGIL